MKNLEHELKHVPFGNRGKNSRLILPLAALLAYAGCESLPKPTGFEQKPKAEYAAQSNQAIGSDLFPDADYGGHGDGPDPILPAVLDQLRAKYNTLPQAATAPFDTAYSEAAQKYQRAAKAVATQGTSLELKVVQDDRSAAKPSGEQAANYDISWMPYLTGDWSRNRKVDFDDFFPFVDKFGLKRGDKGYDAAYDLDGNGVIDFNDFFQFVDRFGMFQSGVGVRASPTIEGKLQVAVPYVPGVRYLVGGKSVGAGSGDSLVVDVDVPPELYGQPVRLEAVGVNAQGDPIAGGLWRGDMPDFYYKGGVSSDMTVRFNLPSVLPPTLNIYVVSKLDEDAINTSNFVVNEKTTSNFGLDYSNGQNNLYLNPGPTSPAFNTGVNTIRFRKVDPSKIDLVVISNQELKANF